MDDNKDSKTVAKGWTVKNFLIGGILLVFGCLLYMADLYAGLLYVGDSTRVLPPVLNTVVILIGRVAIFTILIGISGFWFIIPAFQKWWGTEKRWLVWIFLIIGLIAIPLFLRFLVWNVLFIRNLDI